MLILPLSSGEWELLVNPEGQIFLSCKPQGLKDGHNERYLMPLGDISEDIDGPDDLIAGINLIRSQGLSEAPAN